MLFYEVSAKSNINVDEALLDLTRAVLNKVWRCNRHSHTSLTIVCL